MMEHVDYAKLRAEQAHLERLLGRIPEENVIDRMGLEARLEKVSTAIGTLGKALKIPARARITFRGKPVVGSHGILASFGVNALQKFEQMVAKVGAALREGSLSATGPIPGREEHRLLITGTAVGSFGFELEEHVDGPQQLPMFETKSALAIALERTTEILQGCLGSDEDLAETVSDLDFRVMAGFHDFLEMVAQEKASFNFEYGKHVVRFPDSNTVLRGAERLKLDNVNEEEVTMEGILDGYLPHLRTFEFTSDEHGLIRGKIMPAVQNLETLKEMMQQRVRARLRKTVVGGGKPRFALLALPDLLPQGQQIRRRITFED